MLAVVETSFLCPQKVGFLNRGGWLTLTKQFADCCLMNCLAPVSRGSSIGPNYGEGGRGVTTSVLKLPADVNDKILQNS